MVFRQMIGAWSLLLAGVPWSATPAQDQRLAAQRLLSQNAAERRIGLATARATPASRINVELQNALITALKREGEAHLARYRADQRRDNSHQLADPEFITAISEVVASLRVTRSIPALTSALGTGFSVIGALAAFGEQAVPSILSTVSATDAWYDAVNHGLITLRFMVEGAKERPLSPGTIEQIQTAAQHRLASPQYFTTLWWAIDLAIVLGDSQLRQTVESIATDPQEVIARGIDDPRLIQLTQKRAAERLAGVPPLPRPR